jgi:hypothetical protein
MCFGYIEVLEGQDEIAKMLNVQNYDKDNFYISSCLGDGLCERNTIDASVHPDTVYFNCRKPKKDEVDGCGFYPRNILITSQAYIATIRN